MTGNELARRELTDLQRENLDAFIKDIGEARSQALVAPTTHEEAAALTKRLGDSVTTGKNLKLLRDTVIGPLKLKLASLERLFKEPIDALEQYGRDAKKTLVAWKQHLDAEAQRQREEAYRKQEEAARREQAAMARAESAPTQRGRLAALGRAREASLEQAQAAASVPVPVKGIRTDAGTFSTRKRWTFEVVKPEEVPRQYLKVDEQAIRAAVAAGERSIPGVNIYEDESGSMRT